MDAARDRTLETGLALVALGGLAASGYLAAQGATPALCGLVINAALLVGVLLPGSSGPRFGVIAATVGAGFATWLVWTGMGRPIASLAGLGAMALALGLSALRLAAPAPRRHRAVRAAPGRAAARPHP